MKAILTVMFKEVRESLRDRRVLMNTLLIGPFIGPIIFVVLINVIMTRELAKAEKPLPVVVIGAQYAPNLLAALKQAGLEQLPAVADPEAAVREQRADLVLRISASFADDWRDGRTAQVEVIHDSSRTDGNSQTQRLRGMINAYASQNSVLRLVARGLSPATTAPLVVANRDLATPQSRGAVLFGMLPYFLVFAAFFGGMFLAIDATAGERERQSLEPLLVNPVERWKILTGKLLATSAFSLTSVCLSIGAFLLAGKLLPSDRLEMTLELGWRFAGIALPVMVTLVLLLSILQTLVAAFAKSFREAQTHLGLLQLLPMIPSMLLVVVPFKTQLWMFAVPLVGQQLTIMRLLRGEVVTAAQVLVCMLFTMLASAVAFVIAQRVYASERLAIST
jgi:sodium transport system permease protein